MQHEITTQQELLGPDGLILEEGFSRRPLQRYRRGTVRAPWWRIKEWDYYAVIDHDSGFGVTLTASDLGYAGLFALCLVDLERGAWEQVDMLLPLPRGRTGFAEIADEEHTIAFDDAKLALSFEKRHEERVLRFRSDNFSARFGGSVSGEISLRQPDRDERIVIATSWDKKRSAFYFNQKINCMPAQGGVRVGQKEHHFLPESSFGVLDWGRGHWTYQNRWYWASASGTLPGGRRFGFNLGYGFSDRTPASENALFVDGRMHKLDRVSFQIDTSDYLAPWRFASNDDRLELEFEPVLDRNGDTNLLVIRSTQHQCFGRFSGTVILDDGARIEIEDLWGFAEDVYNRW